jgi:hypothetical protein
MDRIPIKAYAAAWHAESNTGRIFLRFEEGQFEEGQEDVTVKVDSPGEFAAMVQMLSTHARVSWDAENSLLVIPWRKLGSP